MRSTIPLVALILVTTGLGGCGFADDTPDIPDGHVSCPYERRLDCGLATGDPAVDNDDSNLNGTPDAYEPASHMDSDGDGTVDTYDPDPYGLESPGR